jgi:6-phosphogluconolactonase
MRNHFILRRFDGQAALEAALQALIQEELQAAHDLPHAIILSGGRTPLPVYERIAREPFKPDGFAHVIFSDDRHVPFESEDSNLGHARPMLDALGMQEDRVLHIDPTLPLEAAARAYEDRARAFFARGGMVTIALLGLGADGHTCSLFTEEDLTDAKGRYAIPVRRPQPPHRVSITPEVLARAERIVFMACGEEKAAVVEQLLEDPRQVVAGRAVAHCEGVSIWQA